MVRKGKFRILCSITVLLCLAIVAGCTAERELPEQDTVSDSGQEHTEAVLTPEEDNQVAFIMNQFAETGELKELADFLILHYGIPEEFWTETRYYYNYIDLNDDGTDEIFAVLVGDYTSGSGGDSAVILTQGEDGMFSVMETFTFFRTPVVISDTVTNGWHEIIYPVYGGGIDPGYVVCRYAKEKGYQTKENEIVEEFPEDIQGIQILSNNLIDDMDRGNYLTLAPKEDIQQDAER